MTEFKKPINWNDPPDPLDKDMWDRLTGNFWLDTPTSVEGTLDDDCHIASSHVYPVERVAEAPTTTGDTE